MRKPCWEVPLLAKLAPMFTWMKNLDAWNTVRMMRR